MTNAECYIGKSETRGNIPPLVRAVALPGDGGLANLFCRRAFANLAAFRFTRQGKKGDGELRRLGAYSGCEK
jgi:hypothetical protein